MTRKTGPIIRIRVLLLRLFSKWFGSMWPRVHVMSSKRRCVLALRGLTNPASKLASSRGLSRCWKKYKPRRKLVAAHVQGAWPGAGQCAALSLCEKTVAGTSPYERILRRAALGHWSRDDQESRHRREPGRGQA